MAPATAATRPKTGWTLEAPPVKVGGAGLELAGGGAGTDCGGAVVADCGGGGTDAGGAVVADSGGAVVADAISGGAVVADSISGGAVVSLSGGAVVSVSGGAVVSVSGGAVVSVSGGAVVVDLIGTTVVVVIVMLLVSVTGTTVVVPLVVTVLEVTEGNGQRRSEDVVMHSQSLPGQVVVTMVIVSVVLGQVGLTDDEGLTEDGLMDEGLVGETNGVEVGAVVVVQGVVISDSPPQPGGWKPRFLITPAKDVLARARKINGLTMLMGRCCFSEMNLEYVQPQGLGLLTSESVEENQESLINEVRCASLYALSLMANCHP